MLKMVQKLIDVNLLLWGVLQGWGRAKVVGIWGRCGNFGDSLSGK